MGKKKWRKIGPLEIVLAFLSLVVAGSASYSRIAAALGIAPKVTVSRQAVHKRMSIFFVAFLKALVSKSLNGQLAGTAGIKGRLFESFSSVPIHDSSCIAIPGWLAKYFPGAANGRSGEKAMMKIDAMLDIKRWAMCRLNVLAFRNNDQSQALVALESIKAGALLMRDLGYFTCKAIAGIVRKEAFFLSRLKYGVGLSLAKGGKPVDLGALLKKCKVLDQWFYMGKEQVWVRLVAVRLPADVAAERRRKALKDRDGRTNHSDDYMDRLDFTILVTNVGEETWTAGDALEAYGYRWFVETLFKSWKSHFNLAGQPCPKKAGTSYEREPKHPHKAEAVVMALLLLTVLVQLPLMRRFYVTNVPKQGQPMVSMLKVARLVADHWVRATAGEIAFLVESIPYTCKYDTRRRPNAASRLIARHQ